MIHFSDLHLHPFKAFNVGNSRLYNSCQVLMDIGVTAIKNNCRVTFSGDLYHNPDSITNATFTNSLRWYDDAFEKNGVDFIAISGNHDMPQWNSSDNQSQTYLNGFKIFNTFHLIDFTSKDFGESTFWGIPYVNSEADFIKVLKDYIKHLDKYQSNYLLIHADLPGAQTPMGFESEEFDKINKDIYNQFARFKYVFAGHIHKPQKLSPNTFMVGSPIHQTAGDLGCKMGYWNSKDGKPKFVPLIGYPEFVDDPKFSLGNYLINQDIPQEDEVEDSATDFSNLSNSGGLVKKYMKAKKIKSKRKKRLLTQILNEANA